MGALGFEHSVDTSWGLAGRLPSRLVQNALVPSQALGRDEAGCGGGSGWDGPFFLYLQVVYFAMGVLLGCY
jgi:hypothetical protein